MCIRTSIPAYTDCMYAHPRVTDPLMELDRALRRLGLEVRGSITKAETHCSGSDVGVEEVRVVVVSARRQVVSDPNSQTARYFIYAALESRAGHTFALSARARAHESMIALRQSPP